jgi:hypothetical protein
MNDQLDPELQDRFAALDGVEPADTWPSILASAGGAARTWRRRLVLPVMRGSRHPPVRWLGGGGIR